MVGIGDCCVGKLENRKLLLYNIIAVIFFLLLKQKYIETETIYILFDDSINIINVHLGNSEQRFT